MKTTTEALVVVGCQEHARYAAEIDAFLTRVDAPATARWRPLSTWLQHNPRYTPWSVLLWRDGSLVAAALLARSRFGMSYRFSTLGEHHLASWLPAADPASAVELADVVASELDAIRVPWRLDLHTLEVCDPVADELARRLEHTRVDVGFAAPRLEFERDSSINAYISRNTRSSIAKARNRIKGADLAFEVAWADTDTEIVAVIPELIAVCRKRNIQKNQNVGLLEDPAYRAFYADVMRAYAADGNARLLTVRLNGELAAFAMCLLNSGLLYVYSNRIAPEWDRFSPGLIANAEVIRAGFEDPEIRGIDWGGGVQRYKLSGNAVLHQYQALHAWSSKTFSVAAEGLGHTAKFCRVRGRRIIDRARTAHIAR